MRVQFKVNLGSNDAERHALDFRSCLAGAELDVSEKAASWLISKGIATAVVPAEIRGVPSAHEIMAAPVTREAETESTDGKQPRKPAKQSHNSQKDDQ